VLDIGWASFSEGEREPTPSKNIIANMGFRELGKKREGGSYSSIGETRFCLIKKRVRLVTGTVRAA